MVIRLPGLILTLVVILTLFVFEAYVRIVNHFDGKLSLPSNFGNPPPRYQNADRPGGKKTPSALTLSETPKVKVRYTQITYLAAIFMATQGPGSVTRIILLLVEAEVNSKETVGFTML